MDCVESAANGEAFDLVEVVREVCRRVIACPDWSQRPPLGGTQARELERQAAQAQVGDAAPARRSKQA